jgi:hypothetical protein
MFDRIKNFFQRPPDIEKVKTEVIESPQPKGDVLGISGPRVRRRLLQLMSSARRDYTVKELRQAVQYPMIGAIINSIVREVESHQLIIDEKEKGDDDAPLNQLRQVLKRPNNYDRNLRIFLDGFMRELLTVGWVNVEKLRDVGGQAGRVAKEYLEGKIDERAFLERAPIAKQRPGQILGWIARDAAEIWMDGLNGFYNVGDISTATALTPAQKAKLTYWRFPEDMIRIFWGGTTETEHRLTPIGPTAVCYPIIDILYNVLVVLRERVTTPTLGKLVSFIVPKDAVGLRAEQFNDLVEAFREDVASGSLPVLSGVRAFVDEIGAGMEAEQLILTILGEFKQIAWAIYGVGWVQMGELSGQGRQLGKQQMEAAEKQAVGHMLNIIREDFLENEIIDDPWSPYGELTAKWVDVSAIPTRAERMEKEWVPMMRRGGLPLGAIIESDYPEMKAILEAQGIDIWALQPPELEAAMIRAGFIEGEEVPEEEREEEEAEEEEEEDATD